MMESKITQRIRKANEEGRKALIPFLPAGFPDKDRFWDCLLELDKAGVDVMEIGVPFSDSVADGPTVEQASLECLERGVDLAWILEELGKRRSMMASAIVLMGYYNPFLQYGLERLAKDAAHAGVSGFIVPDLPFEEQGPMREALEAHGMDMIPLIGLNTGPERLKAYADHARGFAYFVSVLGTTGERVTLPEEIAQRLGAAKAAFDVPLALGFGIKTPDQLSAFAEHLDAVVFGSALITHIREGKSPATFLEVWK